MMYFVAQLIPRQRWKFVLYAFGFFSVVGYMVGYSPNSHFVRWPRNAISTRQTTVPCFPRTNIVFLKAHKCASSSVQNILMRYAHQHDLNLLLPVQPNSHLFSLVQPFKMEMVSGAPWGAFGYNIICHHMVFHKPEIEKLMPKDSLYISIMRDPVSLFESLYEYDQLEEFYHMDIEEYARATKNVTLMSKLRTRSNGMGRNQMLFDFGIHPAFFNNRAMIQRAIDRIDSDFDFIMISEFFDESIVILKHMLCWSLDDVISLTINARMDSYKKNLSVEIIKHLEEWNWADKMLYDHFLSKFHGIMKEFGEEKLRAEVQELRLRRNEWFEYCVRKKVRAQNLTAYNIWSNKVSGYVINSNISNITCQDLVKPEKYFTSEMRQKQLVQSLMKGATVPNHGPISLRKMLDFSFLKGKEKDFARKLLLNQYKHNKIFERKKSVDN